MKNWLIAFCSLAAISLNAQTALIAHKSHSGSGTTFFVDPNSNFGRKVMPELEEIDVEYKYSKINDSLVLREKSANKVLVSKDTLKKPTKMSYRQFKKFDQGKIAKHIYSFNSNEANEELLSLSDQTNEKGQSLLPVGKSTNKETPSFLFVLFCVSAVLMLLIRIIFRDKKSFI